MILTKQEQELYDAAFDVYSRIFKRDTNESEFNQRISAFVKLRGLRDAIGDSIPQDRISSIFAAAEYATRSEPDDDHTED